MRTAAVATLLGLCARPHRLVGVLLLAFIVIVFGLTMAKVQQLGDLRAFEAPDHVLRPQLIPQTGTVPEVGN